MASLWYITTLVSITTLALWGCYQVNNITSYFESRHCDITALDLLPETATK